MVISPTMHHNEFPILETLAKKWLKTVGLQNIKSDFFGATLDKKRNGYLLLTYFTEKVPRLFLIFEIIKKLQAFKLFFKIFVLNFFVKEFDNLVSKNGNSMSFEEH